MSVVAPSDAGGAIVLESVVAGEPVPLCEVPPAAAELDVPPTLGLESEPATIADEPLLPPGATVVGDGVAEAGPFTASALSPPVGEEIIDVVAAVMVVVVLLTLDPVLVVVEVTVAGSTVVDSVDSTIVPLADAEILLAPDPVDAPVGCDTPMEVEGVVAGEDLLALLGSVVAGAALLESVVAGAAVLGSVVAGAALLGSVVAGAALLESVVAGAALLESVVAGAALIESAVADPALLVSVVAGAALVSVGAGTLLVSVVAGALLVSVGAGAPLDAVVAGPDDVEAEVEVEV